MQSIKVIGGNEKNQNAELVPLHKTPPFVIVTLGRYKTVIFIQLESRYLLNYVPLNHIYSTVSGIIVDIFKHNIINRYSSLKLVEQNE